MRNKRFGFPKVRPKKITFPKGHVYFSPDHVGDWAQFGECDSLEIIETPKELQLLHNYSADCTLLDYMSGKKIKSSKNLQMQLKGVSVKNTKNFNCEQYFPALADKILKLGGTVEKRKRDGRPVYKIYLSDDVYEGNDFKLKDNSGNTVEKLSTGEFLERFSKITGSKYEYESGYDDGGIYHPYIYRALTDSELAAYNKPRKEAVKTLFEKINKTGTVEKDGSSLIYKINLSSETYNDSTFYAKDAAGKTQDFTQSEFLDFVKEISSAEYKLYSNGGGRYSSAYLYRSLTAEELAAYNQNRKDAVKSLFEEINKTGTVEKDGSSLIYKISLSSETYSGSTFYAKDAAGKTQDFTQSEFLDFVKEISSAEYKLYSNGGGRYSSAYLYRSLTAEELAAYNKPRKEAVKILFEEINKTGTVEKNGSGFYYRIVLSGDIYKRSESTFYAKDAAGKTQDFTESEFLSFVKEITGIEYKLDSYLYYGSRYYYIYRSMTAGVVAAYNQNRKDSVKTLFEEINKNGIVVKDGSSFYYRITLSDKTYDRSESTFHAKDAAGKTQEFTESEFLNLLKEITGNEYKLSYFLDDHYNNRYYCIYRPATEAEVADSKKNSMKTFFAKIAANGKLVKNGKKDIFSIPLSGESYSASKKIFYMTDVTGKNLEVPEKDFLALIKETYGQVCSVGKNKDGTFFLWREPTKDEKILIAFNEGTLHTNLAAIQFNDKKGEVSVKGFSSKNTAFEKAGLNAKDVVKKIVLTSEKGTEKEISYKDLLGIKPGVTVTFTVERKVKKETQTLTFTAPVEWDEKELKKIK